MGVNEKFLLAWLPRLDLRRKELIKLRNSPGVAAWLIGVIGMIKPLSAVKRVIAERFYKQRSRENIALKADVVSFAAFISARDVIIRISEINNGIISKLFHDLKGVFKENPAVSPALIVRVDADRTHRNDGLYIAVFVCKLGFCVHHTADDLSVRLDNMSKLRDKILMLSHHMDEIVLVTAWEAQIPERLPGKLLNLMSPLQ